MCASEAVLARPKLLSEETCLGIAKVTTAIFHTCRSFWQRNGLLLLVMLAIGAIFDQVFCKGGSSQTEAADFLKKRFGRCCGPVLQVSRRVASRRKAAANFARQYSSRGESGPAAVAGKPGDSLLVQAIR